MQSALSLRNTRAVRPTAVSRRTAVVPKAVSLQDLSNMVGNAFVRIFSAPQTNVEKFPEGQFSGKIAHHEGKRAFADGWKAPNASEQLAQADSQASEGEASEYLGGAVKRVMGNNFTGDATEPPSDAGNEGFKGKIHSGKGAEKDGFHSKKF